MAIATRPRDEQCFFHAAMHSAKSVPGATWRGSGGTSPFRIPRAHAAGCRSGIRQFVLASDARMSGEGPRTEDRGHAIHAPAQDTRGIRAGCGHRATPGMRASLQRRARRRARARVHAGAGSTRRRLADPGRVAGGSGRMGEALPVFGGLGGSSMETTEVFSDAASMPCARDAPRHHASGRRRRDATRSARACQPRTAMVRSWAWA